MIKATVTDIQHFSHNDGPGIRTTVFFKGCPLNCRWCHNPECISFETEEMFYPEKCIGCGKCDDGCFSGARVTAGRVMSIDDIMKEIISDRDYYGENGGVTFSGGEPMAQKVFLSSVIDECKKEKINCAAETSLIIYDENILNRLDFVMADFKIWDDGIHKEYTGVSNKEIKNNIIKLDSLGIPYIIRTPVIVGIEQEIDKISQFLKELKNITQYELLPYHTLGLSKSVALGRKQQEFKTPDRGYMEEMKKYAFIR